MIIWALCARETKYEKVLTEINVDLVLINNFYIDMFTVYIWECQKFNKTSACIECLKNDLGTDDIAHHLILDFNNNVYQTTDKIVDSLN